LLQYSINGQQSASSPSVFSQNPQDSAQIQNIKGQHSTLQFRISKNPFQLQIWWPSFILRNILRTVPEQNYYSG